MVNDTNPKSNQDFNDLLNSLERLKQENHFKTLKEIQDKIFPDKNEKYLSNGIRDLKNGKNQVFARNLKKAIGAFKENPHGIHVSDHVFFSKMNQRQDRPFSKNEIDGTVGKYLMFSIYDNKMILISSFEVLKANEETNNSYDSLLFFKANRINEGYSGKRKEKVDIKTNGFIMKNSTDKLICYGRTNYADAIFMESLAISGFGNSFERNKTGMWFGISFTNHQKIFALRFVLVKIIGKELEEEFEQNRRDIIRYHAEEDFKKNELINKIASHSGSVENILFRLKEDEEEQPNFIKLTPYD